MALEIYTSGDLAFMESIMTGLGHVYNDGFMGQIFAMALLANALLSLAKYITDQKSGFLTSFWQAIFLYLIMFSSTTTITLYKENEGYRPIAGDFPVGVMFPAHYISLIGHKIAERFKENIVAVNYGWGMTSNNAILDHGLSPLESLIAIRNANVTGHFEKSDLLSDPDDPGNASSGIEESMQTYYTDCVFKAMAIAKYDSDAKKYVQNFNASINAEDQWESLFIDEGWVIDITLDGRSYYTTCANAHGDIGTALAERAEQHVMGALLSSTSEDSTANKSETFDKVLDMWIDMDNANNAQSLFSLSRNYITHYTSRGACSKATALGEAAVQTCTSQYDSVMERRYSEASKYESFLEMLGPMITFIEGFVYAISPFAIVLVLFSGAAGLKMMGKYFTALLWIVLIPVCNVLVDVYLNVYFNRWLASAVKGDVAGNSLASISAQESVWTDLESFVAFAGTAQAMVPALAMFIIFAGVHTLQGMGASLAQGASIGKGTLHANQAIAVKDGSGKFSNDQIAETKDIEGNFNGKVNRTSATQLDGTATDQKMSINPDTTYSSKLSTAQTEMAAFKVANANGYQRVVAESTAMGDGNSITEAGASQMSKVQMKNHAFTNTFDKTYGVDEKASRELGSKVAAAAGGGIDISAGGDLFGVLDLSGKAQASLNAALEDNSKFAEGSTRAERIQQVLNEIQGLNEQINDVYSNTSNKTIQANNTDTYTEQDNETNAVAAEYAAQKSRIDELAANDAVKMGSSASTGTFFADAALRPEAAKEIFSNGADNLMNTQRSSFLMHAAGIDGLKNEDIADPQWKAIHKNLSEGTPETLKDTHKEALFERIKQNAGINEESTPEDVAAFNKDLSKYGISSNGDGNYSFESVDSVMARHVGIPEGDMEAYRHKLDGMNRAERAAELSKFANSLNKDLSDMSSTNLYEAIQANADTFGALAEKGGHLVEGTHNGVHGGMKGYATELGNYADKISDISSGIGSVDDKSEFLDKILAKGEGAEAKQAQLLERGFTGNGSGTIDAKRAKITTEAGVVASTVGANISQSQSVTPNPEDFTTDVSALYNEAAAGAGAFTSKVDNNLANSKQDFIDNVEAVPLVGDTLLSSVFDTHIDNNDIMEIQRPSNIEPAAAVYEEFLERNDSFAQLLSGSPSISEATVSTLRDVIQSGSADKADIEQLKSELDPSKVDNFIKENDEFISATENLRDKGNEHQQMAFTMMMADKGLYDDYKAFEADGSSDLGKLDNFRQNLQERTVKPVAAEIANTVDKAQVTQQDFINGVAMRSMNDKYAELVKPLSEVSNLEGWQSDVTDYLTGRSDDLTSAVEAFKGKEIYNDKEALTVRLESAREVYDDMDELQGNLKEESRVRYASALYVAHGITDNEMQEVMSSPHNKAMTHPRDTEQHANAGPVSTAALDMYSLNDEIIGKYNVDKLANEATDDVGHFEWSGGISAAFKRLTGG
ncbi:conjugal transfer protein TraG N-terminal domain-containing protein [Vibrio sp. 10N.239.312.D08]|uniref:conjugal transfer protein TraG N-terminal domain-containing protein n=1 Tax=Vibrio sp. 10N.239.312.D08 TaxID=3229978 RepID=UPI00354F70E9